MDEADILADRIAIMSTGYLRCCGSSLFLKRLYGVGYTFTISLNIGADPMQSKNQIDNVVLESIQGSSVISVAGGEIAYRLPFEETASFPDVFEQLDTVKEDLSISTYGISITTLEEVFLKIGEQHKEEIEGVDEDETDSDIVDPFHGDNGEEEEEEERASKPMRHKSDYQMFEQPTFQLKEQSELLIFLEHFFAILYRRWFWGIRDFRALCCQFQCLLFFPFCFLFFSIRAVAVNFSVYYFFVYTGLIAGLFCCCWFSNFEINNKCY